MKQCISEIECKIASIKYDIAKNKQKFEIFKKNDIMVHRKNDICTPLTGWLCFCDKIVTSFEHLEHVCVKQSEKNLGF